MEDKIMIKQKDELLEILGNTKALTFKERQKYYDVISKVDSSKFPVILNTFHLANLFGLKWSELKNIIDKNHLYYHDFFILKRKTNKKRKISAPSKELFYIQKEIQNKILENIAINNFAFGFVKDKSIFDNANYHIKSEKILSIDLKDFFPSIGFTQVYYIFYNICGYHSDVASSLAKIVMKDGGLPQGAPTSPIISNIVCYKMDYRLQKLAEKNNIKYSRYADDIVFSGEKNKINNKLFYVVNKIIEDEGYIINDDKTKFLDKSKRMEVTGLVINNDKIAVKKDYILKIRQELYYIKKYGLNNHLSNNNIYNSNYKDHLKGKIMFVWKVDKEKGLKLLNEYNKIFDDI
jgi:RNA-directed DNA polymerase